ncbi:Rha family transcriptional regulator [uncultured Parasutterella sp.]|uniref:Rha family transcriptional regulator n=1 Tax=uncultured Parasutterella sp. TaxID=1263098 RepID=UPI0025A5A04E|nr:Rha family transcriptional regulator [uncultured Parasutterella sp.]
MSNSLAFIQNGVAVTSSFIISEGVAIQHKNVLELIKKYLDDLKTFGNVLFETESFKTAGGTQKREIAILNEPQTTLLLTFFKNTEIVRKFKVALVQKFYELRNQLQAKYCPALNQLETLTPSQQHQIQIAVAARAQKTAHNYQTIYRALKNRFQVARYDQIPQSQFKEALRFIQSVDLSVPETSESTGEIFYYNARTLSEHELRALANLIYLRELGKPTFAQVYKGLRSLNSELAPRFYSLIAEGDFPAAALKNVLSRNQMDFTRPIR